MAPALCADESDLDELAAKLRQSVLDARDNLAGRA